MQLTYTYTHKFLTMLVKAEKKPLWCSSSLSLYCLNKTIKDRLQNYVSTEDCLTTCAKAKPQSVLIHF